MVESAGLNQRDELLGGGASDLDGTSADQRARLLNANSRLENSTKRLEQSHMLVSETEEIGADILRQLAGQRETIQGARKKVRFMVVCAA